MSSIFQPDDDVLLLVWEPGAETPKPVEGRIRAEDAGGVLIESLVPADDEAEDPEGRVFYYPFAVVETILLLEKKTDEELKSQRWEGHLRKQMVLDELDQVFFELAEKKGTYTLEPRPGKGKPRPPKSR